MKKSKYILDIVFATRYPEKYKLADLKPLISLELLRVEVSI
jgi:MoxR-like ATPase